MLLFVKRCESEKGLLSLFKHFGNDNCSSFLSHTLLAPTDDLSQPTFPLPPDLLPVPPRPPLRILPPVLPSGLGGLSPGHILTEAEELIQQRKEEEEEQEVQALGGGGGAPRGGFFNLPRGGRRHPRTFAPRALPPAALPGKSRKCRQQTLEAFVRVTHEFVFFFFLLLLLQLFPK